jgi:hypothetical protein
MKLDLRALGPIDARGATMIYHVSLEADEPHHVVSVFAEIMGGVVAPFPSVMQGSWVALSGDEFGTIIEVYPRGTEMHLAEGDADAIGVMGDRRRNNATHIALGTMLTADEIHAMGAREGWPTKYCKRGGAFGVIEFWVEGCQMVEVLTPEMQREYVNAITIESWQRMLAELPQAHAA